MQDLERRIKLNSARKRIDQEVLRQDIELERIEHPKDELLRIVNRVEKRMTRERRRLPVQFAESLVLFARTAPPDEIVADAEEREMFDKALRRLRADDRMLVTADRGAVGVIALALDLKPDAARKRRERLRTQLRDGLGIIPSESYRIAGICA